MRALLNVDDYRSVAQRKLPRVAFDYVDGGAETEHSVRANRDVFDEVEFRPRLGVRVDAPELATTVFGKEISMPVLLAPCGMARIVDPTGDLAGVRAAGAAGTAFSLTTMSGHSIEEIAAARSGPLFYQVYRVGGRERVTAALERAKAAQYDALLITVDTMRNGRRDRDRRNGAYALLTGTRRESLRYLPQLVAKPRWLAKRLVDGVVPRLENVILDDGTPQRLGHDPRSTSLGWEDLAWVRELWPGPIVAKGVLTGEDARRALDAGVDGIIVSNHGGRQLDGTEPTLRVLPEVVAAVDGRCDVLMDGGIRRGATDVLKAVGLGARAVLIGRPWLFGLAVGGQRGIEAILAMFREDLLRNLGLMGCGAIGEFDRSYLRVPPEWFAPS